MLRREGSLLALVYLPVALFLLLMGLQHRIPVATLTRDPVALTHWPILTGAISNLGILLWSATAAICLFVCTATWRLESAPRRCGLFLWAGLLTAVLTLDDLFLFHENVLPIYLGIPEPWVLGVYAAICLAMLATFRRQLAGPQLLVLLMAGGFFLVSILLDLSHGSWLPDSLRRLNGLWEDGAKLLGIVGWFAFFSRLGFRTLTELR